MLADKMVELKYVEQVSTETGVADLKYETDGNTVRSFKL